MMDIVTRGEGIIEVSLKHSGSLFMYAGSKSGAYAKNSYGNKYTAVGVFVLGRMFLEAWGTEGRRKQYEFNNYLEKYRICISMELVTAVLGDHGQRPTNDYAVVTAVTELDHGKPKFYPTPDLIAFCRKWRLPTNNVWLLSTSKTVASFFAAYDALREEGTATLVCKVLDEIADISVPGSKNHVKEQGEILEGVVARVISHDSFNHMEEVLRDFRPPSSDGVGHDFGPSLRQIWSANRSDEKQQIEELLHNAGSSMCPDFSNWCGNEDGSANSGNADWSIITKFLQAHPVDWSTIKLQEMIRLIGQKPFSVEFKCYYNFHEDNSFSSGLHTKMVIHVRRDSDFSIYHKEMRRNHGLWPLYRGFFVDINLFKVSKDTAAKPAEGKNSKLKSLYGSSDSVDCLADENENLMIKMKFLPYKMRTFLIRNGLSILFKDASAYRPYYEKQMRNFGTSDGKRRELRKMLDEWAVYIRRKYKNGQLESSTYLSEAEPFLEQYAKRCPENRALVGAAGNIVGPEDHLAIIEGSGDEQGVLHPWGEVSPPTTVILEKVPKHEEGLLVFFPGIPGCAKSALCEDILNHPGVLGDNRQVQSLMGDRVRGKYWKKIGELCRKKPRAITLADKNAPNQDVWMQIEDICLTTKVSAIPIVAASEGTDSNPFSLDALAVFMFRVLNRSNHPGNLDKKSPNPGYVLLMFYHLYDGKNRKEFENDLYDRFGALVKMPLLKTDRNPLPGDVKGILEEGIQLYRHERLKSSKGLSTEWSQWENKLWEILFRYADYLIAIQVPFEDAVNQVLEQLTDVRKREYRIPDTERRKLANITYAAVTLPMVEVARLLDNLAKTDTKVKDFLKGKNLKSKHHVTLAHKGHHGVAAVASYGSLVHQSVPVSFTALLFSSTSAALEAQVGCINGEKISAKNKWPHATIWIASGTLSKESNMLPHLLLEGEATQVLIDPPVVLSGVLEFY